MVILRDPNRMAFRSYKNVAVVNCGQPWDCPKTQYGTSSYSLNRGCGAVEKVGLNGYRISITRVAGAAYAVICGFQGYRAHQ